MMEALTAFDAIAIVIVIVSTLMALARGFMRELATLGAFIAAMAAAIFAYTYFLAPLQSITPEYLPKDTPFYVLSIGTFVIVYITIAVFGARLSKSIQGVDGIGILDRLAGGIFGLARGYFALVFCVFLLNLSMDKDQIPEFISKARTYPIIEIGSDYAYKQTKTYIEKMSIRALPLDAETSDE